MLLLLLLAQVEAPLPKGADPSGEWRLLDAEGAERPVQIAGGKAAWIGGGDVRLAPGTPADFPRVEVTDRDGALHVRFGDRELLRYRHAVVRAPGKVGREFDRAGYIHPLLTPSGRVVTNDFPPNHRHHHGVWFPWTSSEFEGRKVDFWNSGKKQGRIEHVAVDAVFSGPVYGGFRVRHRFVDLSSGKTALRETWDVRVWACPDRTVFDLVSTQTCATDAPLVIREYRYGGMGFRGSGQWEGEDVEFLTSEGRTRKDGHATTADWCTMYGNVDGKPCSVGFLGHPSNFRAPQNMRIHPGEPFFNWAPSQAGDFSIEPGTPYVSRYRFIAVDGPLPAAAMNAAFAAYARDASLRLAE